MQLLWIAIEIPNRCMSGSSVNGSATDSGRRSAHGARIGGSVRVVKRGDDSRQRRDFGADSRRGKIYQLRIAHFRQSDGEQLFP
jgi:hypothetical protein